MQEAYPDVFDVPQVLKDGPPPYTQGRTVDFCRTILVVAIKSEFVVPLDAIGFDALGPAENR